MQHCGCGWVQRDAFSHAVEQGDVESVKELLCNDLRLVKRLDAWHQAAQAGNVAILQLLVEAVQSAPAHSLDLLDSPLRKLFNFSPLTSTLLLRKLVHLPDASGMSPLLLAAREGQHLAVAYLLSVGADPWQHDRNGLTALHHAARLGQVAVIRELLADPVPSSERACSVNSATTRYIDCMDLVGWAPLHYAVYRGHLETAAALVSFDANIVARTLVFHYAVSSLPPGCSALHIAAAQGNLPMIQLILRAYYESSADLLPNMLAAQERRTRQRSQPDPRLILSRTGRLAFHVALRCNHSEILEWLDPSIPLMFLLSGSDNAAADAADQQGGGIIGGGSLAVVPRLTVLAAKALHLLLVNDLNDVEEELQAKQKQQEQQKLAEAGKATLVKQAQRFRAMLSKVVKGRSNRGISAPAAQDLMATAPLPGRPTSRPASRIASRTLVNRPSMHHRPRGQHRALVHASARHEGQSGGSAPRTSQSRLVQLLATGINFERQSDYEYNNQNLRMGVAIPTNPDNDPVAVLMRSAANTASGQHALTAMPMRMAPVVAAAASQLTSREAGSQVGPGRNCRTSGHASTPQHSPAHMRHSDPGSLQHIRNVMGAGAAGAGRLSAAAAAPLTSAPIACQPQQGGQSQLAAAAEPLTSPPTTRQLQQGGQSQGNTPLPMPIGRLAGSTSSTGDPHAAIARLQGGNGAFHRISLLDNVVPTAPNGQKLSLRSARHSEPGKPGEFCFSVNPPHSSSEPVSLGQPASDTVETAGTQEHQAEPTSSQKHSDLPAGASQQHCAGLSATLLTAGWEGEDATPSANDTAVPPVDQQPDQPPSQPAPAAQPENQQVSSGHGAGATASDIAAVQGEQLSQASLPIPPGDKTVVAQQEVTSKDAELAGQVGEALKPMQSSKTAESKESGRSGAAGVMALDLALQAALAVSDPSSVVGMAPVGLPGFVAEVVVAGTCITPHLAADSIPGALDSILQDADQNRPSHSIKQLAARNSRVGTSREASSSEIARAPVSLPTCAPSASGEASGTAATSAAVAATQLQDQGQQQQEPGPSAARPAEGEGLGGLLTSIRKHLRKMSVQVVPMRNTAIKVPHERSINCERRTKSFTSGPIPLPDLSDGDSDTVSVADQVVVGAAGGSAQDVQDDVCPVCLDEAPNVQLAKCKHKLCLGCAKDLCNRYHLTPALCPYCRSVICGFSLA